MSASRRTICVVTGTRADYGLLRPVLAAIASCDVLTLQVIITGTHLLGDDPTAREVEREYANATRITMQLEGEHGRLADAAAVGRGISAFTAFIAEQAPDVVLVLGDRVEAFAAASAASVAGVHVAHIHGGDRAVGIADDALRHAISKLSHIHLAASSASVERLLCLGEVPATVHLVGSPAIDCLNDIPALTDDEWAALGNPRIIVLTHPAGENEEDAWANMDRLLRLCIAAGPTLVLDPNHDAGREQLVSAITESGATHRTHLPRATFVGLLRRADVLVGNSSAGLIECAALGVPAINIGTRQDGRERAANVADVPDWDFGAIDMALERILLASAPMNAAHPFGDGRSGARIAEVLAGVELSSASLRKCITY